ncbi:MAG: hypothetical protein JXA35_10875 [Deltaproteobacteria bacterium]|nr:hypothetical protein [Deltaproteobacteria bacterium]
MKKSFKVIIILFFSALLILSTVSLTILYYYHHPAEIKSFLEKSIPESFGLSLTFADLSYSINPMMIQAKGVMLSPLDGSRDFHLKINDLSADLCLEGRFGNRNLIVKTLKINDISSHISKPIGLEYTKEKSEGHLFLAETAKRLFYFLFFRDVKINRVELTRGNITAGSEYFLAEISDINAHMNDDRQMEISCGILLDLTGENIHFTAQKASFAADCSAAFASPEIRYATTIQNAAFNSPDVDIKDLDVRTDVLYDHRQRKLVFESIDLHLGSPLLKLGQDKLSLPDTYIKAGISLDLLKKELSVPELDIGINDSFLLKAGGSWFFGLDPCIEIKLSECSISPEEIRHLIPLQQKDILSLFSLSGKISLNGEIRGSKKDKIWDWSLNLGAGLKDNYVSYAGKNLQFNSHIFGNIHAEGQFPDLKISGKIKGENTTLSSEGIELKPFSTGISLSSKHPEYLVEDFSAHVPDAYISLGNKGYPFNDINIYLKKGSFNWKNGAIIIPEIRINSPLLKNLALSMESDGEKPAIQLQGEDIHLIQSAVALGLLPKGWQFRGIDRIKLKVFEKQKGTWKFSSELDFQRYAFQNQDSSCLAENMSGAIKVEGEIDLQKLNVTANAFLDIGEGEILYDVFYLDLNRTPLLSWCRAEYDISGKSLVLPEAGIELKGIIDVKASGSVHQGPESRSISLFINLPYTPLEPAFENFVSEPFRSAMPFLNELDTFGAFSGEIKLMDNKNGLDILGHFLLHDTGFSSDRIGLTLKGVQLDLPFLYSRGQIIHNSKPRNGRLDIDTIAVPWLPEQSLSFTLEADPSTLRVTSPTTIIVPGGEVQIGPIIFRDIFGHQLSIETNLEIKSVDINPLLSKLWSWPVEGKISGKLDTVNFKAGTVETSGLIKAECFDGEIILSDIGASGIFSSVPVLRLDSQWNGLSLSELTANTAFGKVEGVLRGHAKDLQIAYGQPQKFDLLLETVREKGVAQKISVTAIENIAGIGGGQSPFMGAAGAFTYFFKKFPYNKIGIHASLENDVFRINGTITEDGKEYLMKRGSLSGVNIVNQNPDNRISLKDMINRISRISVRHGEGIVE